EGEKRVDSVRTWQTVAIMRGLSTFSHPADRPSLLRAVSRWQVVALSIDGVIGSGIYLLPARAAALLGAASMMAVPLAGLCVLIIVLCFAEAGSRFDRPGAAYVYTREAFGDFIGFEIGWITWLARIAAGATLLAAFAEALAEWLPGASGGGGRAAVVLLCL